MGYFNEEHSLFRESLREFLEREVRPNIEEWERPEKYRSLSGKKWVRWVFWA